MTEKHAVIQEIEARLAARAADVKRTFSQPLILNAQDNPDDYSANKHDFVLAHLGATFAPNPPEYILNVGRLLKPDGLLLASTLGAESFKELRTIPNAPTGAFSPLPDVRDVGAVLTQYKFALPVIDRDVLTLTFDTTAKLAETLTLCGFDALIHGVDWLHAAELPRRTDGKIPLTLEIIYLHGWFPASNQPAALKPGSAAVSLREILG